jgi:hypothetical protein
MTYPDLISLQKAAILLTKQFPTHPQKFATEGHLQAYCFKWWNIHFRTISVLYAVPNGGTRHPAEMIAMKAQGVRPGVTDLHLGMKPATLFYLEMKNGNRPLDPEQVLFKKKVEALGFIHYKLDTFYQFAALLIALFKVEAATVM